ncbi:MAG: pyrrolo-quinoline quinone [Sphingopyxis sp. SCN 67-31]|nr:MAG: pyrrolo-quinoline quinone [Sphingopyxis sp. SCN 67-31]
MRKRQYVICAMMLALPLAGCGAFKGKGGPRTPTVGERISILSNDNSIKVDPTTAEIAVVLPDPVLNADWAQSGGNASKSMGHPALGAARTKAWEASIAGSTKKQRLAAAPVISNNRLFAVDTDAVVSAFAADTGAKLWSVSIGSTGKDFENSLFGGGASVDGNVVYATSGVGDVAALNAEDGKLLWKVKPAGPLRGAPTVAFGGVYVITQDNQIFALNAGDGAVQWQATASIEPGSVFGAASPAAGQGTIVAGFSSGEVQAYRADPVIDRGRVFALGQGGRMASYDLLTGQRIWEISIAGISTPYVVGEWVYAMTDDGKLLCVARGSGKVRWIQQLARYRVETERKKKDPIRWTGPILAGGRLIAVNSEGQLVEFSPTDGSTLATTEFKSPLSQPPVVANNRLYILADDGTITAWQ